MTDDEHDINLDSLDERLRARMLAAAGRPGVRRIRRHGDEYVADTRSGDQVVQLRLGLRPDGSVSEQNDCFLITDVRRSEPTGKGTVLVELDAPRRTLEVAVEVVGAP